MKVTVKLVGSLVHSVGFSERLFELASGATVGELLEIARIEKSPPKVISRNGHAVAPEERLEDGDRVVIAPVFSGG